ncbi:circadian clock protein KaiC [Bacteriovorax sp. Seq25_V]|uniref:circadian clock protein KaiC n=1 Tax=Bacteriovorax sp. Seq25_V TaxID=1201288 RepID=UPI00038A152D|nr:circadian clock protein KaiC [Bacteriovorax sp. Seq25_V]EQC47500.1 KaiC family protein [Bacteriovorax sp. Seq25_V]
MKKFKDIHQVRFKLDLKNNSNMSHKPHNPYSLENIEEKTIIQSFKTKFNFLNSHKGLQRGHLHMLLGRTNKGKSALIQSLATENIINNYKTLLFLSEGEKGDVKRRINSILSLRYKDTESKIEVMKNLILIDESDLDVTKVHDPQSWLGSLFKFIKDFNIQIAYIDNFSTCSFADSTPEIQAQFVKNLCQKIQNYQIPLLGAVHQSKSVLPNKELDIEDIRANSAFMNSPSFIYALNNFSNLDQELRIIKILKSRIDGKIIGNSYKLSFKTTKTDGFYNKDEKVENFWVKNLFFSNNSKTFAKKVPISR